jgi:enterobacterial common antigen flippase
VKLSPEDHYSMDEEPYNRILKSTTIIGGSSAINIIFKIIQSKAAAVLLGPSGVGLMGLFNAILGMAGTIAGMGLSTSGVRDIAQAASTGDKVRISYTVSAFKWLVIGLGGAGSLILFLLRKPISQITFGNDQQAWAIGLLSAALFLSVISIAQATLLRGMSHIGDLARINIYSVIIGTVVGIPIFYFWGLDGIVPFIMIGVISNMLFSWWYARKITIERIRLPLSNFVEKSRSMIILGIGIMLAGLAAAGAAYLVKTMIIRQMGLETSGLFEASSTLANVYVGFILGAMATDFFPHLSAVSHENEKSSQLINAQVKIGLYLAAPGILAVLALGPLILRLLYSSQFIAAFEILRWQALGTFLRVISWPLGFLILSQGRSKLYFSVELSTNLIYLGSMWLCITLWKTQGIGIAFFIMYIYYVIITTILARKINEFRWTVSNFQLSGVLSIVIIIAFINSFFIQNVWAVALGIILTIGVGIILLNNIGKLVGIQTVNAYLLRVRSFFRFGWIKL